MRKLITALLLITPLSYNIVFAQAGAIDVVCADCRDPYAYPDDYVNFAFNQVYGDRGWMSPRQADDFFIHNLAGDRIYVDVDFDTGLARAQVRDLGSMGSAGVIRKRHVTRFRPGQQAYLDEHRPRERAQAVIDNRQPSKPVVAFSAITT